MVCVARLLVVGVHGDGNLAVDGGAGRRSAPAEGASVVRGKRALVGRGALDAAHFPVRPPARRAALRPGRGIGWRRLCGRRTGRLNPFIRAHVVCLVCGRVPVAILAEVHLLVSRDLLIRKVVVPSALTCAAESFLVRRVYQVLVVVIVVVVGRGLARNDAARAADMAWLAPRRRRHIVLAPREKVSVRLERHQSPDKQPRKQCTCHNNTNDDAGDLPRRERQPLPVGRTTAQLCGRHEKGKQVAVATLVQRCVASLALMFRWGKKRRARKSKGERKVKSTRRSRSIRASVNECVGANEC